MEKKTISFLAGGSRPEEIEQFAKLLKTFISKSPDYKVAKTFTAITKSDISDSVNSRDYDMIICSEDMGSEKIGIGSIREWTSKNPDIKIYVILLDDKRGAKKVQSFWKNGYYDAIFMSDFKDAAILLQVMRKGRTAEEAAEYYGIKEFLEAEGEDLKGTNSLSAVENTPKINSNVKKKEPNPEELDEVRKMEEEYEMENSAAAFRMDFEPRPRPSEEKMTRPEPQELGESNVVSFESRQPESVRVGEIPHVYQRTENVEQTGFDVGNTGFQQGGEDMMMAAGGAVYDMNQDYQEGQIRGMSGVSHANQAYREPQRQPAPTQLKATDFLGKEEKVASPVRAEKKVEAAGSLQKQSHTPSGSFVSSIISYEGFVVDVISDTTLVLEVPDANFMALRDRIGLNKVNLITPRL